MLADVLKSAHSRTCGTRRRARDARRAMNILRDAAKSIECAITGEPVAEDALTLPTADLALVSHAIAEYGRILCASQSLGGADVDGEVTAEVTDARFKMVWALAHATNTKHNERAIQILEDPSVTFGESMNARDRAYLRAVAYYNSHDFDKAREAAYDAIKIDAECRQAHALRQAAEAALVRDGMVGVGLLSAAALATGAALLAAGSKR